MAALESECQKVRAECAARLQEAAAADRDAAFKAERLGEMRARVENKSGVIAGRRPALQEYCHNCRWGAQFNDIQSTEMLLLYNSRCHNFTKVNQRSYRLESVFPQHLLRSGHSQHHQGYDHIRVYQAGESLYTVLLHQ